MKTSGPHFAFMSNEQLDPEGRILSPFRLAGIITVVFAVSGPALAQEMAPAGTGVSVHKLAIDNGSTHTVKYYVKGGSPRLQAVVRRVEWVENELTIVEQLQMLKLDLVGNERRAAVVRMNQLTNPFFSPGFNPYSSGGYAGAGDESYLQQALADVLASEATPAAAMQMISLLEQLQTDLEAQLKALPPQEKKIAEGPVDALQTRLVALTRANRGSAPAQPVVPERRPQPSQPAPALRGTKVEVDWHGTWYAAQVLQVDGGSSLIHYAGYDASWDEWVPADRIRSAGAASVAPSVPTSPDFVALPEPAGQRYVRTPPPILRRR
jgi:hypothetical protein